MEVPGLQAWHFEHGMALHKLLLLVYWIGSYRIQKISVLSGLTKLKSKELSGKETPPDPNSSH